MKSLPSIISVFPFRSPSSKKVKSTKFLFLLQHVFIQNLKKFLQLASVTTPMIHLFLILAQKSIWYHFIAPILYWFSSCIDSLLQCFVPWMGCWAQIKFFYFIFKILFLLIPAQLLSPFPTYLKSQTMILQERFLLIIILNKI